MNIDWQYFSDEGLRNAVIAGLVKTLQLTVCSSIGAIVLGALLTLGQLSGSGMVRRMSATYVCSVRNVPILIQLFFWYFGITAVLSPASFPIIRSSIYGEFVTVLAISLAMGGFFAEVFRAGVEAVPIGQLEAALANGLTRWQAYRIVIFPQLLPIVLPGASSEVINVLKATTFAMTIGVAELMWQAQSLESESFRGLETMSVISIVYFLLGCSIIISFRGLERMIKATGRK